MEVSTLNCVKYGTTHYYITNTSLPTAPPGPVFILQNELIKHEVNAYKTDVSLELVNEWNKQPSNGGVSGSEFLQEIRTVLLESKDEYSFEIQHRPAKSAEIILWSTKNSRRQLGVAKLIPMSTSEGLSMLTGITLSVIEDGNIKAAASAANVLDMSKTQRRLESVVSSLVVEKNRMEDHMYRAFTKCLNSKKEQIQKLLGGGYSHEVGTERESFLDVSEIELEKQGGAYGVDTDVEDEPPQNANSTSKNTSTSTSKTTRSSSGGPTSAQAPIPVDSDSDATDFEGEIQPVVRLSRASSSALKRKADTDKIVGSNSEDDSDTDFEQNSESIL